MNTRPCPCGTARAVLLSLLALAAAPALGHTQAGAMSGFLSGFLHPLAGLDHVLAMVAVGLWGAQLGVPAIWLLPVTFPLVMACGGFLGLIGIPLPGVELAIAVSAVMLGAMVTLAVRPPVWTAALLVGCFALFHGHAHGTELPPGASGLLYSLGFVTATGLLHAGGIGIGLMQRWPVGQVALRGLGAGVTLGGMIFLIGAGGLT